MITTGTTEDISNSEEKEEETPCLHCDNPKLIQEIESKYGIAIYSIKYYSPVCGTAVETITNTSNGIGFKKWIKFLKTGNPLF